MPFKIVLVKWIQGAYSTSTSQSTSVHSASEALATMRYINNDVLLTYLLECKGPWHGKEFNCAKGTEGWGHIRAAACYNKNKTETKKG